MKNDKFWLDIQIGIFILSIITILYSIIKSVYLDWQILPLSVNTISIPVNFLTGVWLMQFSLKDIIRHKKGKRIEHGYDERNTKVLVLSTMNAGLAVVFTIYIVVLASSITNHVNAKIFSAADFAKVLYPGIIVFFYSFYWYYSKKKNL
ncbi:MAG: hypothetical protein KKF44_04500 [Nanoarchaeota archaeon]|nr:hypothetical protein [Nanoarchaeota archaeon]